jgi:hypothetical protein
MSANLGLGLGALGLLALAAQSEVKGLYYKSKVVPLDGYTFRQCRFDGCTLVLNGTNFRLDHCVIDETTVIQYGPNLVKVIQLFTSRYSWLGSMVPGFAPVMNADGTLSIGA